MRCSVCGRPLRTEASRKLGMGPVCYEKKFGKPTRTSTPPEEEEEISIPGQMNIFDFIENEQPSETQTEEQKGFVADVEMNGSVIHLYEDLNQFVFRMAKENPDAFSQYTAAYIKYLRGKAGKT